MSKLKTFAVTLPIGFVTALASFGAAFRGN